MNRDQLLARAEAIRGAAGEANPSVIALPIAAIGWATVDHERAMLELDAALGVASDVQATPWLTLSRDAAVGASARTRGMDAGAPALIVLEPDTEGRLAASLARFGEGVAVVYLGSLSALDGLDGRLLRGGPAWGPHVVVLNPGGGAGS